MERFVLIVGAHDAVARCSKATTVMPRVGDELIEHRQVIPELDGALVCQSRTLLSDRGRPGIATGGVSVIEER